MSFTIATPEQIESMNEHELRKTLRATIRRLERQNKCLEDREKDVSYMFKKEKARQQILVSTINEFAKNEPMLGWQFHHTLTATLTKD
jgi:hypothetical protein